MNIITIPGETADAFGGNIMTALATLHDGLVLSDRSSLYHATRAYRGIENRDAAVTVIESALANSKGANAALQPHQCQPLIEALELHQNRGKTFSTSSAEPERIISLDEAELTMLHSAMSRYMSSVNATTDLATAKAAAALLDRLEELWGRTS